MGVITEKALSLIHKKRKEEEDKSGRTKTAQLSQHDMSQLELR